MIHIRNKKTDLATSDFISISHSLKVWVVNPLVRLMSFYQSDQKRPKKQNYSLVVSYKEHVKIIREEVWNFPTFLDPPLTFEDDWQVPPITPGRGGCDYSALSPSSKSTNTHLQNVHLTLHLYTTFRLHKIYKVIIKKAFKWNNYKSNTTLFG